MVGEKADIELMNYHDLTWSLSFFCMSSPELIASLLPLSTRKKDRKNYRIWSIFSSLYLNVTNSRSTMRANLWMQGIHAKRGASGPPRPRWRKTLSSCCGSRRCRTWPPESRLKRSIYEWIHLKSRQLQYFSHAFFVYVPRAGLCARVSLNFS